MNSKSEFVVGIDIGLTSAICLVDKNLNVIFLKSKREYKKSEMIDDILKFGKPLLICCDVPKVPKGVLKIAKSLGVKVFHPKYFVDEEKKRRITSKYNYNNVHERDALFSAIIGMKSIRRRLLLKKDNEEKVKVKEVTNNISANTNEKIGNNTNQPSNKKEISDEKIKLRLIEKIKELKNEIKRLKDELEKLRKERVIVRYEYREVESAKLKIENEALKIVIKILKLNLGEDELPYVFMEEINEEILKIIKQHINNFVVISDDIARFYVLENLGIEYVITSKNIEGSFNLKIVKDDLSKYENVGKINKKYLQQKWKERLLEILKGI